MGTDKEGVLRLNERQMDVLRITKFHCAVHLVVTELNCSELFRKIFVLDLVMLRILGMKCMKCMK